MSGASVEEETDERLTPMSCGVMRINCTPLAALAVSTNIFIEMRRLTASCVKGSKGQRCSGRGVDGERRTMNTSCGGCIE